MATLVIIRGNSGSGKTSLAKKLQEYYGRKTLLISQDIVRRDMLKEKVKPSNLSISLTWFSFFAIIVTIYGECKKRRTTIRKIKM